MADYDDVKVTDLVINNISQEKYDELKTAGQLETTQIYLTPTEEGGDASPNLNVSDSNLALMPSAISDYTYNGRNRVIIGTCYFADSLLGQNSYDSIIIGNYSTNRIGQNSICISSLNGSATSKYSIVIGCNSKVDADYAIQLGYGSGSVVTNSDANTFKVANQNGNFEMMDADGKVPLDRLTYVTDQIGDISTALTAILGE